ncbi:hypothetical protein V8E36_002503 [Tilletia maclaganii]
MARSRKHISVAEIALCKRLVQEGAVTVAWLSRKGIIASSTYYRRRNQIGGPRKSTGRPRSLPTSSTALVSELVLRRPDLYLDEIADILFRSTGRQVSLSTIHRTLGRVGLTRKRAHKIAKERSPDKRAEYELRIARYEPNQLVFVDETSYDIRDPVRTYARSVRGQVAPLVRLFNRGHRLSCIAGLASDGGVAPWAVRGAFNEDRFLVYLRNELLPKMERYPRPRSVVVMDNVRFHKGDAVKQLIEVHGCKVEFLSPYSPDFNPIERAFAKVKARFRRRSSSIVQANEFFDAIFAITEKDCAAWFRLAGYL